MNNSISQITLVRPGSQQYQSLYMNQVKRTEKLDSFTGKFKRKQNIVRTTKGNSLPSFLFAVAALGFAIHCLASVLAQ